MTGTSNIVNRGAHDRRVLQVLVTGASGLVGGRLLAQLAGDAAIRVRAASRAVRTWPSGVQGVVTDSNAPDTLVSACAGMDAVVNLASMSEAECAADPQGALRSNAGGTLALVGAATSAGVTRFVQLSTVKVYGDCPAGIITEEVITHPSSHYAITHRASEDYAALHPNAVVLRLSNGFGAPANMTTPCWHLIANNFCRQAAVTGRITISSDGEASRNFIPLSDVVVALHAAASELPSGVFNLGSSASMTILAMAERIAQVCESTLGNRPAVVIGGQSTTTRHEPLEFRTARLRDAGVRLTDSFDDEIARTLLAARATAATQRHV